MESAYTLLLQEEEHRDMAEIADLVGTTRDSVEGMLTGPADTAPLSVREAPPGDPVLREHIAGGLVRHAYAPSPGAS
jgi:predicted transcriptional regulator